MAKFTLLFAILTILATYALCAYAVGDHKYQIGYYMPGDINVPIQIYGEVHFDTKMKTLSTIDFSTTLPFTPSAKNKCNFRAMTLKVYSGDTGKTLYTSTVSFSENPAINDASFKIAITPKNVISSYLVFTGEIYLREEFIYDYSGTTIVDQSRQPITTLKWEWLDQNDAQKTATISSHIQLATFPFNPTTQLFPIRNSLDPRKFRLKLNLDQTKSYEKKQISRFILTMFGGWIAQPRNIDTGNGDLHCTINSYHFDVDYTTTPDVLVMTPHNGKPLVLGQDISIQCADLLLTQRYMSESEYKPLENFILVDSYDEKTTFLWSATVPGRIYDFAVNPLDAKGSIILEPHNKLAVVSYNVYYDGDVQGAILKSLQSAASITFESHNVAWNDELHFNFAPHDDIQQFFSSNHDRDASLSNDGSLRQKNKFVYQNEIFPSETNLYDYSMAIWGPYTPPPSSAQQVAPYTRVQFGVPTYANGKPVEISLSYVSEVFIAQPAVEKIVFYPKTTNFKVDILTMRETTNKLTFTFPRQTYRFEGQFSHCELFTKSTPSQTTWKKHSSTMSGFGAKSGLPHGAIQTLTFHGVSSTDSSITWNFEQKMSYRIFCPKGVSVIRSRQIHVVSEELLTFRYYPTAIPELSNTLHQSTIVFAPREGSDLMLFGIFIILVVGVIALVVSFFNYFQLGGVISRLVSSAPQYGMNSQSNNYQNLK